MAFKETPEEKSKRQALEGKWKTDADTKQAKADAEDMRKFNETTNVDTSANTNPAGDTFKKGGKVKKMASGGMTRGDGLAQRGKTKGRMV